MAKKIYLYILIILVVLLIIGIVIIVNINKPSKSNTIRENSLQKFSDSKFVNNAHLISGNSLDKKTTDAISGFSYIKQTMIDGSLNITLKALNPEYQDQNYIVKPGEKLYFIEMSMNDDNPPNGEDRINDDKAILVDSNDYIINTYNIQ